MSYSLQPYGLQHARLPYPSPSPGACSNSCPLSWWCHSTCSNSYALSWWCRTTISSSIPSPPAFNLSQSSPVNQLFTSDGQSIGASASRSVLLINIQGWFPSGLTGLISLQSKGLLRVFSNTTVQKHQFFDAQLSLCSNCHICTWQLEKP